MPFLPHDVKIAYRLLGLPQGADEKALRRARLALVRKYHPDIFPGDKAEADRKLASINAAVDTIRAHVSGETKAETARQAARARAHAAQKDAQARKQAAAAAAQAKAEAEWARRAAAARAAEAERLAQEAQRARARAARDAARRTSVVPCRRMSLAEMRAQRAAMAGFAQSRRICAKRVKPRELAYA